MGSVTLFENISGTMPQNQGRSVDEVSVYVDDHGAVGDGTTDDGKAIYDCLLAQPEGAIINFSPGKTYLISHPLGLKDNQRVVGNGATLKKIAQRKQALSSTAASGVQVIPVADTSGFEVGQMVALQNAAGTETSYIKRITAISTDTSITINQIIGNTCESANLTAMTTLTTADYISIMPVFFSSYGADYSGTLTCDNAQITGFNFDGNNSTYDSFYRWEIAQEIHIGSFIDGSNNLLIENCNFKNAHLEAMVIGGEYTRTRNCHFEDIGGNSIHLTDGDHQQVLGTTHKNIHTYERSDTVQASTTLNDAGGISATDTTITVTDASDFCPVLGYILIESERIQYAAISGNNLTGCVRGVWGTTAATHADTTAVTAYGVAEHQNGAVEYSANNAYAEITDLQVESALAAVGNVSSHAVFSTINNVIAKDCVRGGMDIRSTASDVSMSGIVADNCVELKIQGDRMQYCNLYLNDTPLDVSCNSSVITNVTSTNIGDTTSYCINVVGDNNVIRGGYAEEGARGLNISSSAAGNIVESVCKNNNEYGCAIASPYESVAANTTLNDAGGINDTDTTITVTSTAGFVSENGYVLIGAERIQYASISGSNLTGCLRGEEGTTAAVHADGVAVTAYRTNDTNQITPHIILESTYTEGANYDGLDFNGAAHIIGGSANIDGGQRIVDVRANADNAVIDGFNITRATQSSDLVRINSEHDVTCMNMKFPKATASADAFKFGASTGFTPINNYALANSSALVGS